MKENDTLEDQGINGIYDADSDEDIEYIDSDFVVIENPDADKDALSRSAARDRILKKTSPAKEELLPKIRIDEVAKPAISEEKEIKREVERERELPEREIEVPVEREEAEVVPDQAAEEEEAVDVTVAEEAAEEESFEEEQISEETEEYQEYEEPEAQQGGRDTHTITFYDKVMQRLPSEFEVSEIGSIDLDEAEKIANETLLLMNEDDLLTELDELQSMGVISDKYAVNNLRHGDNASGKQRRTYDEAGEVPREAKKTKFRVLNVQLRPPVKHVTETARRSPAPKVSGVPGEVKKRTGEAARVPAGRVVGAVDDSGRKALAAEKTARPLVHEAVPGVPVKKEPSVRERPAVKEKERAHEQPQQKKPEISIKPETKPKTKPAEPAPEKSASAGPSDVVMRDADVAVLEKEEIKVTPLPVKRSEMPLEKETIPAKWLSMGHDDTSAYFVDDQYVQHDAAEERDALEVGDLEKITSDLVGIEVGPPVLLREGETVHDKEKITHLIKELKSYQEDIVFEFIDEFKYSDDELEFVHSAITEDDYGTYIRNIDEFQVIKSDRGVNRAVELFGITKPEFDVIQDKLFMDEYKDVNLYEIFDFFREDSTKRGFGGPISKECTYIVPDEGSLGDDERVSIEDDISSTNALIYEENVEEIKRLLDKTSKRQSVPQVEPEEEVHDITDRVVIIEDEDDIDRFVKAFPDGKRSNLRRLLKYLDGLFEKLPETTVKTFANSEYFDLYVKVMNDLDV